MAWSAVERFSAQGIQFVFNILIARILLPEDYGVVAMLNIFLAVSQTFIDSGFANALIRKQDRTEDDFSTVFWFNVGISVVFCLLLWIAAPAIASFYKTPLLAEITRILSLTLVIGAFGAVQGTRLTIRLNFKTRAVISIITITVMGIVGYWMACHGYGVWALVVQNIAGSITRTVLLWLFVKWRPKLIFSKKSFKDMFGFGSKLMATSLFDTLYSNIYSLMIGKLFTPASLGLYNRAESFATFPSSNLYGVMKNVSYPVLCSMQEDKERLATGFIRFMSMISFVTIPAMIGLAAVADPFVHLLLTDKWADVIPLLQILCFALISYPMSAFNITFPNVMGKSETYLKLAIINKCVDVPIFLLTIPIGLKAVCWGRVIASVINLCINANHTSKLIGVGIFQQLKSISHIILNSLVMGLIVVISVRLFDDNITKLSAGIVIGSCYYLVTSKIFHSKELSTLSEYLTNIFSKSSK